MSRLPFTVTVLVCLFFAACAYYPSSGCPDGSTGVSFRVESDASAVRYVHQRYLGFLFDFLAEDGTGWEQFLPGLGCHTNCDGCRNDCYGSCIQVYPEWCAPVIETVEPGAELGFKWDGKRTESPFDEFPQCYCADSSEDVQCLHEWDAKPGRYMAKICHAASFTPLDDGCGGDHLRGDLDNPNCLDVEFDYDLCDREPVVLRIQ